MKIFNIIFAVIIYLTLMSIAFFAFVAVWWMLNVLWELVRVI